MFQLIKFNLGYVTKLIAIVMFKLTHLVYISDFQKSVKFTPLSNHQQVILRRKKHPSFM